MLVLPGNGRSRGRWTCETWKTVYLRLLSSLSVLWLYRWFMLNSENRLDPESLCLTSSGVVMWGCITSAATLLIGGASMFIRRLLSVYVSATLLHASILSQFGSTSTSGWQGKCIMLWKNLSCHLNRDFILRIGTGFFIRWLAVFTHEYTVVR